jgi:cobalt/nickel transport system ATP-binding protein
MLQVEHLSVTYPDGTAAIAEVSFTVADGESVALIGANGAGKTSLMLSLVGVLPCKGTVTLDGISLSEATVPVIRQKAGLVFQDPDDQLFMPSLYDDLAFGLRNAGMAEAEIAPRINAVLAELGIERLRRRTTLKLSGGEKRMAALATVLVMEPTLMLLDEPTAFLDPKARRSLIHTLNALHETKLIATHDLAFAAQVCKRSIIIKEGRIFADGPSNTLLYDPVKMEEGGVEAIGADIAEGI